jgi:hypothetical protein
MLLEGLGAPGIFLVKDVVLDVYACGKTSAVVLDLGIWDYIIF